MNRSTILRWGLALATALSSAFLAAAPPAGKTLILATTTSTQDSGLLDDLIPRFEKQTGYAVKTIAVGSGQAIAMGRRGEADVLLVHSPEAEKALVLDGSGVNRRMEASFSATMTTTGLWRSTLIPGRTLLNTLRMPSNPSRVRRASASPASL